MVPGSSVLSVWMASRISPTASLSVASVAASALEHAEHFELSPQDNPRDDGPGMA